MEFDHHLGRLETVVARDGPIDCIFLGTSMVWLGFDPDAFTGAYRDQTGQDIRCFNFGVVSMPAVAAGTIVPILLEDFRPRLLIYGTSARDYALSEESEQAAVLLEMSWLRYRQGQFSIQGWLWDHCHLCQYRKTLARLLRFEDRWLLLSEKQPLLKWDYGFESRETPRTSVTEPPDPQIKDGPEQHTFEMLHDYKILPEGLSGLEQIIAQHGQELEVLLVEMPVPPTYLYFFGNGEQDQKRFIEQVESTADSWGVPFWQTTELNLIPDDGWWDYSHLNAKGARIFSEWLGARLGSAVVQGKLQNPVAKR